MYILWRAIFCSHLHEISNDISQVYGKIISGDQFWEIVYTFIGDVSISDSKRIYSIVETYQETLGIVSAIVTPPGYSLEVYIDASKKRRHA